ncbi:MAG: hypothetical protein H8M99_05455 [Gloeobacteraceae cyanobacterium ES-bin-144]|nr:hypothetical protein [Verrucomicrobiales bacterium]
MKTTTTIASLTIIASVILPISTTHAEPRNGKWKNGEGGALREEAILDRLDTHGPLGVWEKDRRPADLERYHILTYQRIRGLLVNGSLSEQQGADFKKTHEQITAELQAEREQGLTDTSRALIRGKLDKLNDDINAVVKKATEGNERTPLLNRKEHRMEELIAFGERSGRLSKAEAASLRRKLASLQKLEERLKDGGISTRDREKLQKEANEIAMDLHRELKDQ